MQQLGLPALLLLNMADEAERFGVRINTVMLSHQLAMPVLLISAKYNSCFKNVELELATVLAKAGPPRRVEGLEERLGAGEAELEGRLA